MTDKDIRKAIFMPENLHKNIKVQSAMAGVSMVVYLSRLVANDKSK